MFILICIGIKEGGENMCPKCGASGNHAGSSASHDYYVCTKCDN